MKIKWLALLVCATLNTAYCADFSAQINSKRPNIVLITAEDCSQRFGAYGDSVANTPNIDKLAKESAIFDEVYTMAPVSSPSRAGLITGKFPQTQGLQHMRTINYPNNGYVGVPEPFVKGYPEILRANGYFTYVDTKTDYQFCTGPYDIGPFTLWDAHGDKTFEDALNVPIAYRNYDLQGKPFFLHLNPQITHESGLFRKEKLIDKSNSMFVDMWDKLSAKYDIKKTDPNKVKLEPYYPDTKDVRIDIAKQYDNIQVFDQMVGKIVSALKEDNLWDNTIVIVSTDHGDGLPRHKRDLYDSGLKVPFIVHIPKQYQPKWWPEAGKINHRLISFEDLAPTILGFANCSIPTYMHGIDLSKDNAKERDYVYAARDRFDEVMQYGRTVRNAKYSYVYNDFTEIPGAYVNAFRENLGIMQSMREEFNEGRLDANQNIWFKERPKEELYDKEKDPFELNNLAQSPEYQDILTAMRSELVKFVSKEKDLSVIPEDKYAKYLNNSVKRQQITKEPFGQYNEKLKIFSIIQNEGASIGYRINDGTWNVYSSPIQISDDIKIIEFKAVIYGYKESLSKFYTF